MTRITQPMELLRSADRCQPSLPRTMVRSRKCAPSTGALAWRGNFPAQIYAAANFLQKRISDGFVYANQGPVGALYGTYLLTNARQDHYTSEEIEARRTFANGYKLFAAYTHSSARTNAALDYQPAISLLGPQQSGPLPWDTPNRVISWGWLPLLLPKLKKNWDFVYTLDWHTGFPYRCRECQSAGGGCGRLSEVPRLSFPSAPASNGAFIFADLTLVCAG